LRQSNIEKSQGLIKSLDPATVQDVPETASFRFLANDLATIPPAQRLLASALGFRVRTRHFRRIGRSKCDCIPLASEAIAHKTHGLTVLGRRVSSVTGLAAVRTRFVGATLLVIPHVTGALAAGFHDIWLGAYQGELGWGEHTGQGQREGDLKSA